MKQRLGLLVLYYLRFFARLQLKKFAPDIVGITGSAGKTSTRNAVYAVLKDKYQTKVSIKANSESGIPLNILGIKPRDYSLSDWLRMAVAAPIQLIVNWHPYEKYVVEMGIDSPRPPKNMDFLLSIIQPRTGIFLNALPVHTQQFAGSVKAIALEKGKLIKSLPTTGLAIVNADDPEVVDQTKQLKAQMITFGTKPETDVKIREVSYSKSGTKFSFATIKETGEVTLEHFLPKHFAYSLAAALCVNLDEGNTLSEGCTLLEKNFKLPAGRMTVFKGIHDSILIDSSYNASAQPTIDALDMLAIVPGKRKIALLGDMRELGQKAKHEHERVMDVARKHCDQIFLVGPLMELYALPYLQTHKYDFVDWFATAQQAGERLKDTIQKGDVVLFKGSQNTIYLESAVEMVLANSTDKTRLCRRGTYWDQLRTG